MSLEQIRAALDVAADLPAPQRHVLLVLATYADADGRRAFPSVATLSRQTGLARASVQRALAGLKSAALIRVQEPARGTLPTCYQLTLPASHSDPLPASERGASQSDPPHTVKEGPHTVLGGASQRGPIPQRSASEPKSAGARAREGALPAQAGNGTSTAPPVQPFTTMTREEKAAMLADMKRQLAAPPKSTLPVASGNRPATPTLAKPILSDTARLEIIERRRREAAAIAAAQVKPPDTAGK